MGRSLTVACLILLISAFAGCGYQGRRIPTDVEAVPTQDFNPTDLQIIGGDAVTKLLAKGVFPSDKVPFMYVAAVRNLTNEHINGEAIRQFIEVEIDDSDKFDLLERSAGREEAIKELELQQGALIDPATTSRIGKHVGAEYFFMGTLTNIETRSGRKKGQYFLFTLKVVNVETARARMSRVQIQKLSKKGLFGW